MIDIENELRHTITTATGTSLLNEYPAGTPEFPLVTMEMKDNTTYLPSYTGEENHINAMFEFNVYSNKVSGPKTECKTIFGPIDEKMLELGFVRSFYDFIPNLMDSTIKRLVVRYVGVVGTDKIIYRR